MGTPGEALDQKINQALSYGQANSFVQEIQVTSVNSNANMVCVLIVWGDIPIR
jgi:hypothetical protein